jgi:hypothetical protein
MRAKPQPPSGFSTIPGLPTGWVRLMKDLRRWTGWQRNRKGASPSPLQPQRAIGTNAGSTSSTRLVTWTSPSRSNGHCEFWMGPSPYSMGSPVWNPSPKRCGTRPTSSEYPGLPSSIRWTVQERIFSEASNRCYHDACVGL